MLIPVSDEVDALTGTTSTRDDIDASDAAVLHHLSDAFFVSIVLWRRAEQPSVAGEPVLSTAT